MAERFEGGRLIVLGALLTALCAGLALAGTPGLFAADARDKSAPNCSATFAPGGQAGELRGRCNGRSGGAAGDPRVGPEGE